MFVQGLMVNASKADKRHDIVHDVRIPWQNARSYAYLLSSLASHGIANQAARQVGPGQAWPCSAHAFEIMPSL